MIRLAVVGTGWITRLFVEAAHADGRWVLTDVLGSSRERGAAFAAELRSAGLAPDDVAVHADLAALAAGGADAVYVATPNAAHHATVLPLLEAGKHVVVEKPAFSTSAEWTSALAAADARGVLLLEAIRSVYEDGYQEVRAAVRGMDVTGASLVFHQYSSRWPAYLAGERPRIFTAEHAGGALADLGVYQLYAAVDWFGAPESASYHAHLLATGVEASGTAVLHYPTFDVTLAVSKAHRSEQPNEVRGTGGEVLAFNNVAGVAWLRRTGPDGEQAVPGLPPVAGNMLAPEVDHLARRIEAFPGEPHDAPYDYRELRRLALDVARLSERLRADAGIRFPADGR